MEGEIFTENHNPFAFNVDSYEYHSRAFLKIQDGCDNHCSYCRVTLARGDGRSLSLDEILERIGLLEAKGYREIVLTGINLTSWRMEGIDFAGMLSKVLDTVKNSRIRLSSLEPETITAELAGYSDIPDSVLIFIFRFNRVPIPYSGRCSGKMIGKP